MKILNTIIKREFNTDEVSYIALSCAENQSLLEQRNISISNGVEVVVPVYEQQRVEVPEFMDFFDFQKEHKAWKRFVNFGGCEIYGERAYYKLSTLQSDSLLRACIKMISMQTVKSNFLRSLKSQILKWINGEVTYQEPLSIAQQKALIKIL